jgi:aryl-alcohol dehydrogenase-like predicted oxidoreductase
MNCPQSPLGKTGISLSRLVFGSMRLNEKDLSDSDWQNLLRHSYDLGITTVHSSDEYESFPRFTKIVRELQTEGLQFQHIVKLGEPHFGSNSFSTAQFNSRIESYCQALRVDKLDVVQWLWRGDLKDEASRLQGLAASQESLQQAIETARANATIGAFICFPYTISFAEAVISHDWCDGLSVYLNPLETEMQTLLPHLSTQEKSAIAIRPLAAAKALNQNYSLQDCLTAAFASNSVTAAMVSWSSEQQLKSLLEVLP